MGQRHNRRRTRPRSRNRNQLPHDQDTTTPTPVCPGPGSPLAVPLSSIWSPQSTDAEPTPIPVSAVCSCPSRGPAGLGTPAPTWHYGYTTWQTREGVRDTSSTVEAAQCRVFGGEPGDDVALCERMLEYFGGLDYINS
ncbi:hypothetical protein N7510_001286 [Penicillium lagena]|uniref:uncharacterized protein n=1 Tax=Penicillium lagena TaxID=94218 RepID=UPI002540C892|nr:uncharacterized protein N7510_001286 [Penicillium lagena]KAJ5624977.1 hypothetical protein N7510_001286 [Penicillium lagena]